MIQGKEDLFIPVIGLEIHAQLLTESKIFAADSTKFGAPPNTNVSVITLGHPGVMPKLNKRAVEFAIKMGLACGCRISRYQIFDRKNYFYPDLPKGYQITQDKTPACIGGSLTVRKADKSFKEIRLNHIHLEEDAGKSLHQTGNDTLVDLNRAGVPLIEMVTEPDMRSSEEAYLFMIEIRKILLYLEICDGNMEEGSLRCDANVSVMKKGDQVFGQKVEIKNMNSFRNVQRAIDYEIMRQISDIQKGHKIHSETRTFDANSGKTFSMRTKETLNDYRYFPDPDLSPVLVSDEWLEKVTAGMPTLPQELAQKFKTDYGLPEYDAQILTDTPEIASYFIEVCRHTKKYKAASNWMMGPVKSLLNEKGLEIPDFPVDALKISELINLIDQGKIAHATAAKEIFPALIKQPDLNINDFIGKMDLQKDIKPSEMKAIIDEILTEYPEKVIAYKKGKKGLLGLFMGELMKKTRGKADPKLADALIRESLE